MKITCDTNIILDVLLDREPFADDSSEVLKLCEERKVEGLVPATCITDIFYITRKFTGSTEDAYRAVGKILDIVRVATVTNNDVILAYQKHAKDFEDCIVAMCSITQGCDYIVTRNTKDYAGLGIPAIEPAEFLNQLR